MNSSIPPAPINQSNPVEFMRYTQETLRRRIDEQLSPSDRLIVHSAEDITMRYARAGFWIGTLAGGMLAFRSRIVAGRKAMQQGGLPRLFYPTKPGQAGKLEEELAKNAAKADGAAFKEQVKERSAEQMRRSKAIFFGKAIGYGILGSVVGLQTGIYFGRSAANRMVEKSGRGEAIEAATHRGVTLASQEISQKTGAKINLEQHLRGSARGRSISSTGGSEDLQDGIGYQEPGRELSHETMSQGIGYSDRAPPQENFPESLSGSAPSGSTLPGSSSDSNGQSRWEELRRSRASPPSSWDVLRESNTRAQDSQRSNGDDGIEDASAKETRLDKERKKREFEAMFDREAKGGDDGLGEKENKISSKSTSLPSTSDTPVASSSNSLPPARPPAHSQRGPVKAVQLNKIRTQQSIDSCTAAQLEKLINNLPYKIHNVEYLLRTSLHAQRNLVDHFLQRNTSGHGKGKRHADNYFDADQLSSAAGANVSACVSFLKEARMNKIAMNGIGLAAGGGQVVAVEIQTNALLEPGILKIVLKWSTSKGELLMFKEDGINAIEVLQKGGDAEYREGVRQVGWAKGKLVQDKKFDGIAKVLGLK